MKCLTSLDLAEGLQKIIIIFVQKFAQKITFQQQWTI